MQQAWETFFNGIASGYMEYIFTKNTITEVDFILEELNLQSGSSLIDIGCGTGRHAIELAKRGYNVTGVDISLEMLAEASESASEVGVTLNLVHADATQYTSQDKFSAAICLCEGAFGLINLEEDPEQHDFAILSNIHKMLEDNASLIVTCPNGLAKIRQYSQADVDSSKFDPYFLIETVNMEWEVAGVSHKVLVRERGYIPHQLPDLFNRAGFEVMNIWGGTAGNWGRRPVQLDEVEIMVVAKKQ